MVFPLFRDFRLFLFFCGFNHVGRVVSGGGTWGNRVGHFDVPINLMFYKAVLLIEVYIGNSPNHVFSPETRLIRRAYNKAVVPWSPSSHEEGVGGREPTPRYVQWF